MKKLILIVVAQLFSLTSFAYNSHVPCNLTNPDQKDRKQAEQRIEDLLRTPAAVETDENGSVQEEPNRD